jgi:hypothetical protein
MLHMKYDVVIKRKVAKGLRKLPVWVQKKMAILAEDLREKGPEQLAWQTQSDRIPLPSGNVLGGLLEASEPDNNYRGVLCWQS